MRTDRGEGSAQARGRGAVGKPVRELAPEVARKIAAGEVIDRPAAVVRELVDNSIDAGATRISVEIAGGGAESIRVADNGCGMTADDLAICAHTHTTSKISAEDDLLSLSTLGFRGEALSSVQAVSRLEITTTRDGREAWKLELGRVVPSRLPAGTVVRVDGLFENFPARRQFLKRAAAETALCRQVFVEKALAWPDIEFRLSVDSASRLVLPPASGPLDRCLAALQPREGESFFHEIAGSGEGFSFVAALGSPDVVRPDRRQLMVFVNGRRIQEYALQQAVEYGAEGHFPNGGHPFCCLFVTVDPALVDFNIHPAKREARFRDPAPLHRAVSQAVRDFYRRYAIASLARGEDGNRELDGFATPVEAEPDSPRALAEAAAPYACAPTADVWRRESPAGGATFGPASFCGTREAEPPFGPGAPRAGAYAGTEPETDPETGVSAAGRRDGRDTSTFRYLGQALGTFLAVERNGCFYLIDQHAAHERILYDALIETKGDSQELLVPYRIETPSAALDRFIAESRGRLAEAGFTIEDEGEGVWQVTAVPARWTGTRQDLEDGLCDTAARPESLVESIYARAACRAACKDGDVLDPGTARDIVARAFALREPVCPHGRPIWIVTDRAELFRRIRRT